jgi:hypothetical protein
MGVCCCMHPQPGGCPSCNPSFYKGVNTYPQHVQHIVMTTPTLPKGCICPAGSDVTCQRPDCGRKPYDAFSTVAHMWREIDKARKEQTDKAKPGA